MSPVPINARVPTKHSAYYHHENSFKTTDSGRPKLNNSTRKKINCELPLPDRQERPHHANRLSLQTHDCPDSRLISPQPANQASPPNRTRSEETPLNSRSRDHPGSPIPYPSIGLQARSKNVQQRCSLNMRYRFARCDFM
jgi:hypothetical protein